MGIVRKLLRDKVGLACLCIVFAFVGVAAVAPWIMPYDPYKTNLRAAFGVPSRQHFLGTDQFGRDILSRTILGTRITLRVVSVAISVACVIGIPLGMLVGFRGGKLESFVMRATDILLVLPPILLAIVISAVLGPAEYGVILALTIFTVPQIIRLTRGVTLQTRDHLYVEAARAQGAGTARILFRHILPNISAPIVVNATVALPTLVLTASALSYLGLGVQPPHPEWGQMLNTAKDFLRTAPHLLIGPGVALFVFVFSVNMLGDAAQGIINPRLRK
jgi:ABC-type dipeptide/oligopeptide/nickel transport system permease subunit